MTRFTQAAVHCYTLAPNFDHHGGADIVLVLVMDVDVGAKV